MSRSRPLLLAAALCLPGACASAPPVSGPTLSAEEAARQDLLARLAQRRAHPDDEDVYSVLNSLEHLMPSWQAEQRRGKAAPLETELTLKVVPHFDALAEQFLAGPHDRQVVAAWALGFSRVPDNDLGLVSRHREAIDLLLGRMADAPDDVMRNIMIALWEIGDPATPLRPLLDVVVNHHDAEVRANAMLALSAIFTDETLASNRDVVLVGLEDSEAKVRLHAATIARLHPDQAFTPRMESILASEPMPLVRANLAAALGAAGSTSSAPLLTNLLNSPRMIESLAARRALTEIFGEDRGPRPADWQDLLH